jgi:hypothetical protein
MDRAIASAVLLVALVGCSTPKKDDGPPRPVRFAVIAAPEVGADDGDLAMAVTKLSREPELDFVLVPGPLLAPEADATSLELLRNDLGQIAPAVYVGFACVTTATSGALKSEDVLGALEKMGPGAERAVAYDRVPPRAPRVRVSVIGCDGKSTVENKSANERLIQVGRGPLAADLTVVVGSDKIVLDRPSATLLVAPLSRSKLMALVTIWPERLEVQPFALEGRNPPELEPIAVPRLPDAE